MTSENNKDYFESKEGKVKRNEWRKLISIIIAVITLYLLNAYDVFDYTGYIVGSLLVVVWVVIINYVVNKISSLYAIILICYKFCKYKVLAKYLSACIMKLS